MNDANGYDIFVLGLDPRNLETLREVQGLHECRFHALLSVEELLEADELPLQHLLDKAEQQLHSFDGTIDAIVGYWDFPVSTMVPILCQRLGLRSASLRSVLACEHKYWSRLEQQKVINEHPAFGLVELDDESPPSPVQYPFWLKPVKAFSSELAFKIENHNSFREAMVQMRAGIGRVGEPFQFILDQVDLPREVAEAGGESCLAEQTVSGQQVTVEGYNTGSEIRVYGVVDSYNYPGTSSFQRYEYPSSLPSGVLDRLVDVSKRVIAQIELESAFNIEYFWNSDTDEINLLEINPRHSQSHAKLFDSVDGLPNHQCMVQLALGHEPTLPHRQGPYGLAATWFLRRFTDALVRRIPTAAEVSTVERENPGCEVDVAAREGERLSDLPEQDSYSYALATLHIGADSSAELHDKYERCVKNLPFDFDD